MFCVKEKLIFMQYVIQGSHQSILYDVSFFSHKTNSNTILQSLSYTLLQWIQTFYAEISLTRGIFIVDTVNFAS